MTLQDRCDNYASTFPKWPAPRVVSGCNGREWLEGFWIFGNDYRSKSGYYGSYPPNYLARIMALFPDATRGLHLFSGSIKPCATFDCFDRRTGEGTSANIIGELATFDEAIGNRLGTYDLVLADPPYSVEDAERYGCAMVDRKKALDCARRAARPGGFIAWMDQAMPMYRKDQLRLCGLIACHRSTNHRFRCVAIFQTAPATLSHPPRARGGA